MKEKNKKIEDLLTDDSFIRWINEEAEAGEIAKWEKWLRNDPVNTSKYQLAIDMYRGVRFKEESTDTIGELKLLNKSIARHEMLKHRNQGHRSYYRIIASVAVLILIGAILLFSYSESNQPVEAVIEPEFAEVNTRYGQIQQIKFPDGSSVTLNANSTLQYPEPFKDDEITLTLDGEAYFEMQPFKDENGERRKFSVETPDGYISIIGTSFNVNTRENETNIVLDEGEVEVVKSTDRNISVLMKPGEMARLSMSEGQIEVHEVNTEIYTSWRNLEWVFDETSLAEIAKRIEASYGVEVKIADKSLNEMKFSGTAPNQNLSVLLEGLKTLLDVPIEKKLDLIRIGEITM